MSLSPILSVTTSGYFICFVGYFVCVQQGGWRTFNLTQSRRLYRYLNSDGGFPHERSSSPLKISID